MTTITRIKWMLFLVPALVIGLFETIRHTLLQYVLPMEIGNWTAAVIDAFVIALVSRTLLHQFARVQKELGEEKQAHAVLRERERLAKVLHDQIAQSVFFSGVQINLAKKLASNCNEPELLSRLEEVTSSLREIDENIRQSIFNLKSESSEHVNLKERISSYFDKILSGTEVSWNIAFPEAFPSLSPSEHVQLFGIAQEAATNIVKHAHASHVWVSFTINGPQNVDWSFSIRDDGIGFDSTSRNPHGHGLGLMENRAKDISAELTVNSSETGTTVTVTHHPSAVP